MTIVWRNVPKLENDPMPQVATVRITGDESIAQFQELVNRAMNCWDRAPVELKEFADMVTEGKLLQDYQRQEGKTPL